MRANNECRAIRRSLKKIRRQFSKRRDKQLYRMLESSVLGYTLSSFQAQLASDMCAAVVVWAERQLQKVR